MPRQFLLLGCLYLLLLLLATHSSCASSTVPISIAQGVVSTAGNDTTAPRAISACSCSDCRCRISVTETCPVSIPASGTSFRSLSCINGKRPLVKSVRADSTDGSKFRVYGLNADNYSKYRAGQSFNHIPEISTVQDVTCTEKSSSVVLLDSSYAYYFGFYCNNFFSNCPIRFEVDADCVVGPATTIELFVSKSTVYNDEMFYATATLKDSTGAIDTYATEMVYLRVYDGPGPLWGTVGANPNGGVANFRNLTFTAPGIYKLVAQYESLTALSSDIQFFKVEVASIQVTLSPYRPSSGRPFTLTVRLYDKGGDLILTPGCDIQVTKFSGPGRLFGTTTSSQTTINDLWVNEAGTYKLSVTCGSVTGKSDEFFVEDPSASSSVRQSPSHWLLLIVALISLLAGSHHGLLWW